MWGNILVGVKPGADLKIAPKTTHIHSPDEEKMPADMKDMRCPAKTRRMKDTKMGKKPDEMSDMPGNGRMDHGHGIGDAFDGESRRADVTRRFGNFVAA